MRLLLDTHTFLCLVTDDPQSESRQIPIDFSFKRFFAEGIAGNGFSILPIEIRHAAIVGADAAFGAYGVSRLW
jgi:PIN domain nuclease of toxin-antitoxin system